LTLHPAQKFHGFRDIERLAAREVRLVRMGRANSSDFSFVVVAISDMDRFYSYIKEFATQSAFHLSDAQ
jgi:hypothetical protein